MTAAARFLALGDSYTIGEGVAPEERWPVQLAAALRHQGATIANPEIVAKTGWTTDELVAAIDSADPRGRYDLVSLLIGVNNQYRGLPLDDYGWQFAELLGRAIAFGGGEPSRVLVLSIPDWGVTPFAEGRDRGTIAVGIDAFNAINRAEALRGGARYVDITPASRRTRTDRSLVGEDGLHPSAEMYRLWAELALPLAALALRQAEG